jgi:hypothetical protein
MNNSIGKKRLQIAGRIDHRAQPKPSAGIRHQHFPNMAAFFARAFLHFSGICDIR